MTSPPKKLLLADDAPLDSDNSLASGIHPIAPLRPASAPPPPSDRLRPSTIPPRPISNYPPPEEGLVGAAGNAVRFRPARLSAAELGTALTCRAVCDGVNLGPLDVIDVGASGFAAASPHGETLSPGSILDSLELLVDGVPVWSGEGVVVHCDHNRFGARFVARLFDLQVLKIETTLEDRLAVLREQQLTLPIPWRAAVSDLRLLLESAKLEVEEYERTVVQNPIHHAEEEAILFEGLRTHWAGFYFAAVAQLHARSKDLDPESLPVARSYAASAILPLLLACPVHRRAYEKPLGYAGDFRLMEMLFTRDLMGEGLFGRFMHSVTQRYTLARSVIAREAVMREAVRIAIESDHEGSARVLSMAAGPAIELRKLLGNSVSLSRPLHLFLLDQDEAAHETAHRRLSRILLEQHQGKLPVTLECLHFSVRQLILPRTKEERWVRHELLKDLDLVYSAGLYDYLTEPVAKRLTQVLYSKLRPGGRLLVGNLSEMPDSTWMMEFVVGWHLVYRTEAEMLRIGMTLEPPPARMEITRDATGHCLFLDVVRP